MQVEADLVVVELSQGQAKAGADIEAGPPPDGHVNQDEGMEHERGRLHRGPTELASMKRQTLTNANQAPTVNRENDRSDMTANPAPAPRA